MESNKLKAVIFDWAGTIVDYGCFAPTRAFMRLFESVGVPITIDEVRLFMGTHKRDHIKGILAIPRVSEAWRKVHHKEVDNDAIKQLFRQFVPLQIAELGTTDLIPGTKKTIEQCRHLGLKIGTCTGYTKAMMEALAHAARLQGLVPDAIVCSDEVSEGRPSPFMCFENMARLSVYPAECVVKVGDTPEDIKEGLNACMWTIGLARTGNLLGLTQEEDQKLSPDELGQKLEHAADTLKKAHAHFVVESIADVPLILDLINDKLSRGERPHA